MKTQRLAIVLLVAVGLAGCYSPASLTSTPVIRLMTSTLLSPSRRIEVTLTISATPTVRPSLTAAPAGTPSAPTATVTSAPQPTPTTLPPLLADTAKLILEPFVQRNDDCQLPCVMGVTPGISDRAAFSAVIRYFRENQREASDYADGTQIWSYIKNQQGGVLLSFWEKMVMIQPGFDYWVVGDKVDRTGFSIGVYQYVEEHNQGGMRILYDHPYYRKLAESFLLSHLVRTYGSPAQILIRPFPNDPDFPATAPYNFDVVLFYSQQGFLAEYIALREEQSTDFVGCPTRAHIQIATWDPVRQLTLLEAVEHFSHVNGITTSNAGNFKLLQEATSLSVEEFSAIFSDPETEVCIHTPKKLWPALP